VDIRARLQEHLGAAFQIERELGGGGMSRVFVATEVRLNRRVAIKVLTPELAQGLNAERFEREILMAASLQQANIVPLLSAGDFDGLPYFTMPFIEGESLRQRAGGRQMPIAQVVAVLRDVARALEYAHARGIVHRDIKPDNVLLSGATAVVTDFGIAKALSASRGDGTASGTLTSVGTSIGTPSYMAPEQVAGDPNIDHRVDLYALGCLAFELLAGEPPFGTRTPQKVLAAHLSESPRAVETVRSDCPPALALLVSRLLEKDPADRIGSASEVLRALDDVGASTSAPSAILQGPGMFGRVLAIYAVAIVAVAILAKAAVVGIGLPEWVTPGAVGVMLLGLPVILFTGYVKRVARRAAAASPTLTPGGTMTVRPLGTMATMALRAAPHVSWRKAMRLKVALMSGFVLLVAGFLVTRAMGIGPAASLFAAGTLAADDRIVLADFTAAPEDSALAPIVQSAVREAMGQSRAVQLLDASAIAAELERMERPGAVLDAATARELAVRSGAKAILGGRLARAGSGFAVSLDLVATAGGATLASFQGTAIGPADLLTVVDDLTKKLRGKMGESLKQVAKSIPLEQATTSNLEALRLYTEGTYANDVTSDHEKAVELLRQAVALDSTFALAWRKLSAALTNARLPRIAADSALEHAARHADKLPERERLMVMGALYQFHSTRADPARALETYRRLYAVDPNNRVATNQLAMLHDAQHASDSALHYYRLQWVKERNPSTQIKVAAGLLSIGDTAGARAMFDSLRAVDSAYAAVQGATFPAELAYAAGDIGGTLVVAKALQESPIARNRLIGFNFAGAVAATAGQLSVSERMERERIALQATRGVPQVAVQEISHDLYFRGRPAVAIAKLDRLVATDAWRAIPAVSRPYGFAITAYAEAGAPAKARRIAEEAWKEVPDFAASPAGERATAESEALILLAEGKHTDALASARASQRTRDGTPAECRACVASLMAIVFDSLGQADSAIVWLERFLEVPRAERLFPDSWGLATTNKRLGELYDAKGDRARAMQYYQALVDQWKDADPELQPTVASVRKRIEELKRQGG
jgi:eukaryotic-like serine/threonine-protein kinase